MHRYITPSLQPIKNTMNNLRFRWLEWEDKVKSNSNEPMTRHTTKNMVLKVPRTPIYSTIITLYVKMSHFSAQPQFLTKYSAL